MDINKKTPVLILMSSGGFTIKPNEQNKGNVKDYRDSFRRAFFSGFFFFLFFIEVYTLFSPNSSGPPTSY